MLVWKKDFSERFWCEIKSKNDRLSPTQLKWLELNRAKFKIEFKVLRVMPLNKVKPRKEINDFLNSLGLERFGKQVVDRIFSSITPVYYTSHDLLKDIDFIAKGLLTKKSSECLLKALDEKGLLAKKKI